MRRTNAKIGFDDRLVTLAMVPLASFIIPFIFFGHHIGGKFRPLTWGIYLPTFIITTVIWLVNRYILIWARNCYPSFKDVRKRIMVQAIVMLVFTLLANNLLGYFLEDVCGLKKSEGIPGITYADIMISSNAAALFCSLTVIAIYESIYFMN